MIKLDGIRLCMIIALAMTWIGCSTTRPLQDLPERVENHSVFGTAFVGIKLVDPERGEVLYEQASNRRYVPASNTKILTTYASLKYLPDRLPGWYYHRTPDTLFLIPNGDPTFLHRDFERQHVLELIQQEQKPVVIQLFKEPYFNPMGNGWSWSSYQSTSFPERSQMPIYGNMARFSRENGVLTAQPSYFLSYVSRDDQLHASAAVNISRAEFENRFQARSASSNFLNRPFSQRTDPGIAFTLLADTMAQLMPDQALFLSWIDADSPREHYETLYTHDRDSVVGVMMKRSDNLIAEQLLMMVGSTTTGHLSDTRAIRHLLQNDFVDFPDNPRWGDGSGLSRNNMMSPQFFVQLLQRLEQEFGWDRITEIFPHGNQGTLRRLYLDNEDRIFAKTGSLNASIALSGYLVTKKNRRLVFSFLVNNQQAPHAEVRKSIERFVTEWIEHL